MRKNSVLLISALLSSCLLAASALANTIVPYGNGTWIYDGLYDPSGNKLPPQAGLFVKNIQAYNNSANADHQINEVFPYGGDIEMYCTGQEDCTPNDFLLVFYPPDSINKKRNHWHDWDQLGDSGFRSLELYKTITTKNSNGTITPVKVIVDIDGRVDVPVDEDYLDHMNDMSPSDAMHFADKVAKGICANDSIDGVQFDVEPFSFNGDGGTYPGHGQLYFYTEIAKDFAGYYGNSDDPAGINHTTSDSLHCVDKAHPNGRIFSVFTFAKEVTPTVAWAFTHHDNGYIVDSLYDLGHDPDPNHPQCHSRIEFDGLVAKEVKAMSQAAAPYGLPYQFGIPAAGSVHEYEKGPYGTCIGSGNQIQYVQDALTAIASVRSDPNFKGIDLWAWNSATWWHGMQFSPSIPEQNVLDYLKNNL